MRVFINGRFLTQTITGVQRYAWELTRALAPLAKERGIELTILMPDTGRPISVDLPVEVIQKGRWGGYFWEQLILPWISRKGLLVNLGNVAPAARTNQIVLVYDAAVWCIPRTYKWHFRTLYKLLIPFVGKRARGVASISHSAAADISRYAGVPLDRITVLHAGAEHIRRTQASTTYVREQGLTRPFVLAVGSMSPNKNFDAIIRAFSLIDASGFDLVIAGGVDPLVFAGKLGSFPDHVRFVGRVTDAELKALYEHAALFVFPSFYEGLGFPPMEAMHCGCPVLLSNIPVLLEVYEGAAAFCDPSNDEDIARQIARLMDEPETRAVLAQKGAALAQTRSWETAARELLTLIERITPQR
ncbi:glycosyltransferase family 4 protein [Silvimonas amylolytica]|uniref:Group 1 glycosyl transferase n=1 Tax=Silvimonas amylolytica TaxID=449663 RepID=A0ABQ2PKJ7_9NEIS|nr:glycosyltransferase family 1 protein [Silvimonas amylolytica]GGP25537.1 group 1 glycosyl transferase [Silvimonas amylolytica]